MRRGTRVTALVVALVATASVVTACSTYAAPDMLVLYYEGGTGESRQFKECIEPGSSGSYPVDDSTYELPTSQRTWNIRPEGGDTNVPIKTGSRPSVALGSDGRPNGQTQAGPELNFWVTADFYLNTDCTGGKDSPVVRFWNNTGSRYQISDGDSDNGGGFNLGNWTNMLKNTLLPAEERAIRELSRDYDADVLDANVGDVWSELEKRMAPAFNAQLRDKLGGDYFCGVGYVRGQDVRWTEPEAAGTDANGRSTFQDVDKTGKCPPIRITITDVGFADQRIADSRAGVYAAENDAKKKVAEAQGELDRSRILGEAASNPAYVQYMEAQARLEAAQACRSNPNCTVIIGGDGNVNVNAGGR
jgi:hypothetical protein